ncbi:MAG: response regulator [Anaerolineales bacterium]
MVTILLADDHVVLRSGLKLLLESQPDFKVIGEAATGLETLDLAERLQPDLILLDLSMPSLNGLDALPALRKLAPQAKILILTMYDDPHYLRTALRQGANGYVLKKAADSELISAIRAVLRGDMYVHPAMTRILLEDMLPKAETAPDDAWETLSEREQEVLKLVALGHTSAEIAAMLHLSDKTVETYRARGMEKLGLKSRAALVRYALKKGLLEGE